jgi:hypothetical protein
MKRRLNRQGRQEKTENIGPRITRMDANEIQSFIFFIRADSRDSRATLLAFPWRTLAVRFLLRAGQDGRAI